MLQNLKKILKKLSTKDGGRATYNRIPPFSYLILKVLKKCGTNTIFEITMVQKLLKVLQRIIKLTWYRTTFTLKQFNIDFMFKIDKKNTSACPICCCMF